MAFCPLAGDDAYNQDSDGDGIATIDELFVHYTDPHNADSDSDGLSDYEELFVYNTNPLNSYSVSDAYCDAVAVSIGGLDPFSFPEGSTNTVLEHIFYSGTTNGVFAYPQPSAEVAVLKVMVSGNGTGRLVVGDDVVPLVGFSTGLTRLAGLRGGANPDNPVNPVTNTLLLAVGRGVRKEVWFDKPDGLDVALDSDDFLIGEMPTWYWAHGWLAFPHTDATIPCIHDLYAKARTVTLVHGEEFAGLAATWKSEEQGVAITNVPPVSAEIHGSFPKNHRLHGRANELRSDAPLLPPACFRSSRRARRTRRRPLLRMRLRMERELRLLQRRMVPLPVLGLSVQPGPVALACRRR